MPYTIRAKILNTSNSWHISNSGITFASGPDSGLFLQNSNIGLVAPGSSLVVAPNTITTSSAVIATHYVGNGSQITNIPAVSPLRIANIQYTDASWNVLDDTAVSTDGGFCLVNGQGFLADADVLIGDIYAPTSITVVNQNQLKLQIPSLPNGSYPLKIASGGFTVIKNSGIQTSPFPIWQSAATLSNVMKYTTFTQSLLATEGTNSGITYSSSSLPAGVVLYSNGTLTGNIITDIGNTTTFSFTVQANDSQYQDISRVFILSATSFETLRSSSLIWIDMSMSTGLADIVNLSLSASKLANPSLQNNSALSFDTTTGRKTLSIVNSDITSWQNQGGYVYWTPGSLNLSSGFMMYLRFYFIPVASQTYNPTVLYHMRNIGGSYPNWIDTNILVNAITGDVSFFGDSFINTSTSSDVARTLTSNAYNTVTMYYNPAAATFKIRVNGLDCISRTNVTVKSAPQNLTSIKNIHIGRSDEIQGLGFIRNIKLYRFALLNTFDAGLFDALETTEFFTYS